MYDQYYTGNEKRMYKVGYKFIDKSGRTRKAMEVIFNDRNHAVEIIGNATELQAYAAIDGNADFIGKLDIVRQYMGEQIIVNGHRYFAIQD